ncbi:hypothetical protein ACIQCF_38050 [Streptomyces sp. NPDC088353]|uniref:hypothetical protein n=1 Tax=Streptomyces sp. NPDC088353 TaxID=3365855 RepID=UPI0037FDEF29
MDDRPDTYELRFGWNGPTVRWALVFLLLAVSPLLAPFPLWALDVLSVIGLMCLCMTALIAFLRRVALRVGPEGLTLGDPFTAREEFFAWPDVVSVRTGITGTSLFSRVQEIDVRYRAEAAEPREPSDLPIIRRIDDYLNTQVDSEFLEAFRGTSESSRESVFWRIDHSRLESALTAFAPHVRLFASEAPTRRR